MDDFLANDALLTQTGYQNPSLENKLTAKKSLLQEKIKKRPSSEAVPRRTEKNIF